MKKKSTGGIIRSSNDRFNDGKCKCYGGRN